ncbi:ABC transporter permease [Pedobacter cryoconitis]|uniref:Transport permease protein n=1 Tax=Pedobacter cryoconitis TaxID=188932 RepID=A0A7X0J4M7_9SPHI|nr:ABC transporter permease [Pedobacter cryoconitis]MBB6500980.1 lipopolysaccharide transport system permease protein [Pedobacter cryoconitis]
MEQEDRVIDPQWTEVIEPRSGLFKIDVYEIWRYRDLLVMLVRRDFVTYFKQTVLGPVWFFVTPIFTTIIYVIVFGNIANISTDGIPQIAFYLCGVTLWNYFSTCLNDTATVFSKNATMLGKVYFPRLIMPLSIVVSKLMQFGVQFLLFIAVVIYFWLQGLVRPNLWILASPLLIVLMAAFSLGLGMIFSSLTVKYRDMVQLLTFGVQLFMYATPVIYPVSTLPERYKPLLMANPLTAIFEAFKYAYLGAGEFSPGMLVYSSCVVCVIFMLGVLIFNKVEKNFADTI